MKQRASERGQALVEFALVLPLLLLLIVGIVEFGRIASHLVVLRNGGYELVRAASVNAEDAAIAEQGALFVSSVIRNPSTLSWYELDPVTGASAYVVLYSGDGESVEMRLTPAFGERYQGDTVRIDFTWKFRPIFTGWILPGDSSFDIQSQGRVEYPPQ